MLPGSRFALNPHSPAWLYHSPWEVRLAAKEERAFALVGEIRGPMDMSSQVAYPVEVQRASEKVEAVVPLPVRLLRWYQPVEAR